MPAWRERREGGREDAEIKRNPAISSYILIHILIISAAPLSKNLINYALPHFSVKSLKCWLCDASDDGPTSFGDCKLTTREEKCRDTPAPACAMFIYKSKKGVLIHARSCTYQSYCGSNGTFCKKIALGGSDCRLECCDGELCNDKQKFRPTTPPGNTQSTELTTAPTEEPTTVETKTTLPTHETTAPDYDDDDDDCSWIDAGSTHLISGILLLACALSGLLS